MTENSATSAIDLRCPVGAEKLLGRVRLQMGSYTRVTEVDNLLELACRECRNTVTVDQGRKPALVVHRFNILGQLVESEVLWE